MSWHAISRVASRGAVILLGVWHRPGLQIYVALRRP